MSYSTRQLRIDLSAYLLASASITALIGQRLYSVRASQNTAKPYVVLEVVNKQDELAHDGPLMLPEYRIQFFITATTTESADQVGDAIANRLCPDGGLQGTIGASTKIGYCVQDNELDGVDSVSNLFYKVIDFRIKLK